MKAMRTRGAGFSLIEVLVVIVLLVLLAAFLFPKLAGSSKDPTGKGASPRERAKQVAGWQYEYQVSQAIAMYRMDNDGQNPPNLQALKKYGVVDEMLYDPNTRQPIPYDPRTGRVGRGPGRALPQVPGY